MSFFIIRILYLKKCHLLEKFIHNLLLFANMSDTSFGISDIRCGDIPENITSLALKTCQEHIGLSWDTIDETQLILRRITGSLTNQLYYCGIPDDVPSEHDEPREMVLMIYGKKLITIFSAIDLRPHCSQASFH